MRTLAVDGTTLMLPNHQSIKDEFGTHKFGPKANKERSIARAPVLYDVLNLVTIDSQIDCYKTSELEQNIKQTTSENTIKKLIEQTLLL